MEAPLVVIVTVEIFQEKVKEFLEIMEKDAVGSRAEPGCLQFDVTEVGNNTFHFIEVYKSAEALAEHQKQAHYKLWTDFKARGGVKSQSATKSRSIMNSYRL